MTLDFIQRRSASAGAAHQGYALMMLVRPLGPYLAWVALRLGLKPRHVTYFTFGLAWVILAIAAIGGPRGPRLALAMLIAWEVFDVTDGTMARALGVRDNFGGFLDYAGGMVIVAFLPLALAIGVYASPDGSLARILSRGIARPSVASATVLVSGAVVSVISLLMRLVNRVLFLRFGDSYSHWAENTEPRALSVRRIPDMTVRNLDSIGGLQAVVLLAAAFAGVLEIAIVGYLAFYIVVLIGFMLSTYRKYRNRHEYGPPNGGPSGLI